MTNLSSPSPPTLRRRRRTRPAARGRRHRESPAAFVPSVHSAPWVASCQPPRLAAAKQWRSPASSSASPVDAPMSTPIHTTDASRSGVVVEPGAAPCRAGLPCGRRHGRTCRRVARARSRRHERARFVVGNLVDAAAPSNNPLLNPTALKAAIDSGGTERAAWVAGVRRRHVVHAAHPAHGRARRVRGRPRPGPHTGGGRPPRRPLRADPVRPADPCVHTTPLLIVPPTINKYYVLDLAPGRSLIEDLVQQGLQVFTISWRNPDARFRDCGLDAYGTAVVDALDAVRQISRAATANMIGVCSGGIIASMALAHLARPAMPGSTRSRCWSRSSNRSVVAHRCARRRERRRRRDQGLARTGYLDGTRWPRCSPGCAPTTSSGTTG